MKQFLVTLIEIEFIIGNTRRWPMDIHVVVKVGKEVGKRGCEMSGIQI